MVLLTSCSQLLPGRSPRMFLSSGRIRCARVPPDSSDHVGLVPAPKTRIGVPRGRFPWWRQLMEAVGYFLAPTVGPFLGLIFRTRNVRPSTYASIVSRRSSPSMKWSWHPMVLVVSSIITVGPFCFPAVPVSQKSDAKREDGELDGKLYPAKCIVHATA